MSSPSILLTSLALLAQACTRLDDGEAEWLALELDGTLVASSRRYQEIHADLQRIRRRAPELEAYERQQDSVEVDLLIDGELERQLRTSGLSAAPEPWADAVKRFALELLAVDRVEGFLGMVPTELTRARMRARGRFSGELLAARLRSLPGVLNAAEHGGPFNKDPPAIRVTERGPGVREYVFARFMDCPSGCIESVVAVVSVTPGAVRVTYPESRATNAAREAAKGIITSTSTTPSAPRRRPAGPPGSE